VYPASWNIFCSTGYTVTRHTSASDLLEAVNDADFSVVLADHAAVATAGLQLQAELAAGKLTCPVMFMAENADVKTSVQLLRDGAADFLEKPLDDSRLLQSLDAAFSQVATLQRDQQRREQAQARFDTLTPREQEIMQQIVRGTSNRALATRQEVSVRTIKVTPFQGYDQNGGHQPARAGAARRPAGRD